MKIILLPLLCLILIGMTSNSYAGSHNMTEDLVIDEASWITGTSLTGIKLPEVLMQSVLRDSNGNLLGYVESEQIIGIHLGGFDYFLDHQDPTSIKFFIKDDKKYESQQWEIKGVTFDKRHAWSATRLIDVIQNEFVTLLQIRHDSYQTQPGDTVRIFWTVIRSVS